MTGRPWGDAQPPDMKRAKESVDYGPSTGADRCGGCLHFTSSGVTSGVCDVVEGPIAASYWCVLYERAGT